MRSPAEPIAETVELIEAAGGEALAVPCDVRDPAQVDAFFDACGERFGAADLLVDNAAGNFIAPAIELSPNGWNAVINIVLNGSFHCSRAFALRYREAGRERGSIVSVIATYAWTGNAGTAHSAAAKAGVQNLMMTLAVEWADLGIRCNSIAPGPILTPGATAHLFPTEEIQQVDRVADPRPPPRHPRRRGRRDAVPAQRRLELRDGLDDHPGRRRLAAARDVRNVAIARAFEPGTARSVVNGARYASAGRPWRATWRS